MEPNYNPFSLAGKTVLITGASSGIGQATAIACSRMGARVVVTARNQERLQQTFSQLNPAVEGHMQQLADLTSQDELENLLTMLPPLDGAVLSAGNSTTLPLQFGSREKFDEMFNVNFFAPVELLRLLYKKKRLNKGASVVLLASIGGTHSFMPGNGVYGASKAALNSIMKYAAREYASRRVRVWLTRLSSIGEQSPRSNWPRMPRSILWDAMVCPMISLTGLFSSSVTLQAGSRVTIW